MTKYPARFAGLIVVVAMFATVGCKSDEEKRAHYAELSAGDVCTGSVARPDHLAYKCPGVGARQRLADKLIADCEKLRALKIASLDIDGAELNVSQEGKCQVQQP